MGGRVAHAQRSYMWLLPRGLGRSYQILNLSLSPFLGNSCLSMTSVEGTPEGAEDNSDENRAKELVETIVSRVLAKI